MVLGYSGIGGVDFVCCTWEGVGSYDICYIYDGFCCTCKRLGRRGLGLVV